MLSTKIINLFSRFMTNNIFIPHRNIYVNVPIYLNVSNVLCAEPLKKKKKVDPALVRAREERKRKKLEKSIRRLEKTARQLKPIFEIEVPTSLRDESELQKRNSPSLSIEKLEERAKLMKEWNIYKTQEHKKTLQIINELITSQDKTLDNLKIQSEELYLSAIQIDPELLPYSKKGPVHTPPIPNFDPPDGEYIDITKKYEGEE